MEVWKDLVGFEGIYEVSNIGRVKSLKFGKVKILRPSLKKNGYYSVQIYDRKKSSMFLIHRLVAIAFIPNPEKLKEVNHINGIKTDNRNENLEWVSRSQNMIHANKNGLQVQIRGEKNKCSKLTEKQAIQIKYHFTNLKNTQIALMFNISPTLVASIKKGVNWPHI